MSTRKKYRRSDETDPDELVGEVTAGILRLQRRKLRMKRLRRLTVLVVLGSVAAGIAYGTYDQWPTLSWRQLLSGVKWPFGPER